MWTLGGDAMVLANYALTTMTMTNNKHKSSTNYQLNISTQLFTTKNKHSLMV